MDISKLKLSLPRIERVKILFQYFLMLFCAFVLGALIKNFLSENYIISLHEIICGHFNSDLFSYSKSAEMLIQVIKYSLSDIISVSLIFVSSFAVFNYISSDLVLIYNGIKYGFSAFFLISEMFTDTQIAGISFFDVFSFILFKLSILAVLLTYSYYSAIYSSAFKRQAPNGRSVIIWKPLASYLVATLSCIGAFLMLNALYLLVISYL